MSCHYRLCALLLWALSVVAQAGPYTATLLPVGTWAYGMNSLGHITGAVDTGSTNYAFAWADGELRNLGVPGESSVGYGISDRGEVTGAASGRAFIYSGGRAQVINATLGSGSAFGQAINNAGQIAGVSGNAAGDTRSFLYQNGHMRDIGTLGGSYTYAYAMNQAGHIVGGASPIGGFDNSHAFVYADGVMRDLGTLGGYSAATAINDVGQIVGSGDTRSRGQHAFIFENGALRDLGTFGGYYSSAVDINNAGWIVGSAEDESFETHPFIDYGKGLVNLNRLVDLEPGWSIVQTQGINDANQIGAVACTRTSGCRAVLLSLTGPIPEPHTYGMLLAGLGLLLYLRRRAYTGLPSAAER